MNDVTALRQQAFAKLEAEDIQGAAKLLNQLLKEDAGDCQAALALARLCFNAGQYTDVINLTGLVISNNPSELSYISQAWELQGQTLEITYQPAKALIAFENCIKVSPQSTQALANYYSILEKLGRYKEAREELIKHLEIFPNAPSLLLVLALCERRLKNYKVGIDYLETALSHNTSKGIRRKILYLLADLQNKNKDYPNAFSTFNAANTLVENDILAKNISHLYRQSVLKNLTYFKSQKKSDWIRNSTVNKPPVFLIGFPRTGSTLLEQILSSHRDFFTVEERPVLQNVLEALSPEQQKNYPESISTLNEKELERLRQVYWSSINQYIPEEKRHLKIVDKQPLNTTHFALLHVMFPEAKVVFTQRHPLDTCLSCYMQDFTDSAAMMNFLRMDTTVELFKSVFDLWDEYCRLLNIDFLSLKYEELISNFDDQVEILLAFLGSTWDENVRDFDKHAIARQSVSTASYHQVSEKLSTQSIYRWKNYRQELAKQIPDLLEHIHRLGYEA